MRAIIWVAVSTKSQVTDGRESLHDQEAKAIELCEANNWQIVDILRVPGHSRRYIDIHKLAEDASRRGISAFYDLLDHFEKQDFDILIARDSTRFARTHTLHAYIIESTLKIGARIHLLHGNPIDESNKDMAITMGGYRAAAEVDSMVKKMKIGFHALHKRGLPINANVPRSHRIVRDPKTGKVSEVVVNEAKRQEFLDLATLVIEGVAWSSIERQMFDRYGYANHRGYASAPLTYYRILHNPTFWGNVGMKARRATKGSWVWDSDCQPPEGVSMEYNTHEPMYTDKLATDVIAELERRQTIKGRQNPRNSYKFSGLFICAECGYKMTYLPQKRAEVRIRCMSRYVYTGSRPDCDNVKSISDSQALKQIRPIVAEILRHGNLSVAIPNLSQDTTQQTIGAIETEIEMVEDQIATMIMKQSTAPDTLRDSYDKALVSAGERLSILKERLSSLQSDKQMTDARQHGSMSAINDIANLGESFWSLTDNEINQALHRLLGHYRFAMLDGEIVGLDVSRL